MPDFGGAFRISRFLPAKVARELLTAETLDADRMERLGFVNRLTPPGEALAQALRLAETINANAPLGVRASLDLVNHEINGDETETWERSGAAHERLLATADVAEGIGAFFERRQPSWTGR
ncbi:hypothetical protein BH09ACT12_BH09ACT12_21410 [soil metagenome]